MSSRRTNHEEKIYRSYLYPGTEVLINTLDIRDPKLLEQAELFYNMERMRQPLPKAAQELTYRGFLALHYHLFQDVYFCAGQPRNYTTGRGSIFECTQVSFGSFRKMFLTRICIKVHIKYQIHA